MSEITALIKTLQKDNKDRAKLDAQRTEDIRAMREAQSGDVVNKGAEIEATKEATANNKKTTNLLKTMSGSLTGILSATKNLASKAKTGFFTALKGLAFGAFLLAVGKFLDSPTFKSLTKKIGEITQKFADIYKVFEEEGLKAGIEALGANMLLVSGAILGIAALFTPTLLFGGLMFGGRLIFKSGKFVLGTLFRAAFGTALFGKAGQQSGGGVFTRLLSGIKNMGSGMKNMVSAAIKSGVLAGSKVVGSIRGAFAGFFGDDGPLKKLGGRLSFMARTMGGAVSQAVRTGVLAGSNILTSLRGRFAGFFADGGPLKKLGSSIGTTVTSMGKRIGSAITKGVFSSGGRGIGSKFALLFSVLGTFSSKLSGLYNAAVPAMRTALQKAVSLLPKSVQKLLPEAFRTVMKAPTRITSSMRTALSSMKGVTLKSATVATAVVPKVIKGIVDMAPEGAGGKAAGILSKTTAVVPRVVKGIVDMAPEGAGGKASKIIAAATAPIVKPAAKLSQSALNALRGTGQVTGRGITSVGQSFINRFPRLKMALKIPIIGPVLTGVFGAAILNDPNLDDTQKKKELGKLVGGQIGAAGFAVIGAALGAPAAGVGGFFSGAALGLTGYFAGEWLGGKMMDWI